MTVTLGSTCLWFDKEAEEAAKFYTSIFKNSKINHVSRYGEAGQDIHGQNAGSVMTVEFELDGRRFMGLNGGPLFKFNESVSLVVYCDTQEEIDTLWHKFTADGGEESHCGWLKDKFGLSWQIVPSILSKLMSDPARADAVMAAFLKMRKFDIAALEKAYNQAA
ncbi:MAG: VOC family protein [Rhodospirillales bacterium]|nr:VOC family protein [Alphaproteobacteria bacterium]MCB9977529.1 VOC family protein [Rhodospirillales bacterium]